MAQWRLDYPLGDPAERAFLKARNRKVPGFFQGAERVRRRNVSLPARAFSVVANQIQYVHLIADYGKLLNGIDFKAHNNVTPFSSDSLAATQIANNILTMFHYE